MLGNLGLLFGFRDKAVDVQVHHDSKYVSDNYHQQVTSRALLSFGRDVI